MVTLFFFLSFQSQQDDEATKYKELKRKEVITEYVCWGEEENVKYIIQGDRR